MPQFSLHTLQIDERYFVLLPKLNLAQKQVLVNRLQSKGFATFGSSWIAAKKERIILRIYDSGVCWGTQDPTDIIAPVIPEILGTRPEPISLGGLESRYFTLQVFEGTAFVRFNTRVESFRTWDCLRRLGECALSPDERLVATPVLRDAEQNFEMLTDFPVEESKVRLFGRFQYYESLVTPVTASTTLRDVCGRRPRNSYLPRNGLVDLGQSRLDPPSMTDVFSSLGEWCGFRLVQSSNYGGGAPR